MSRLNWKALIEHPFATAVGVFASVLTIVGFFWAIPDRADPCRDVVGLWEVGDRVAAMEIHYGGFLEWRWMAPFAGSEGSWFCSRGSGRIGLNWDSFPVKVDSLELSFDGDRLSGRYHDGKALVAHRIR